VVSSRSDSPVRVLATAASAGGFEPLKKLLELRHDDPDLTGLVVMHIGPTEPGLLPGLVRCAMKCDVEGAVDGHHRSQVSSTSHRQTIICSNPVRRSASQRPRENRVGPAADPLFRVWLDGTGRVRSDWALEHRFDGCDIRYMKMQTAVN
jgi:chemotaxis response regulator CheB